MYWSFDVGTIRSGGESNFNVYVLVVTCDRIYGFFISDNWFYLRLHDHQYDVDSVYAIQRCMVEVGRYEASSVTKSVSNYTPYSG